jgi:hypothetical protein
MLYFRRFITLELSLQIVEDRVRPNEIQSSISSAVQYT